MKAIPELKFAQEKLDRFDRIEKRMWATLCFKLAMVLTYGVYGLSTLHQHGNKSTEELLKCFNQKKGYADTKKALTNCMDLCYVPLKLNDMQNPMGIKEEEYGSIERQVNDYNVHFQCS